MTTLASGITRRQHLINDFARSLPGAHQLAPHTDTHRTDRSGSSPVGSPALVVIASTVEDVSRTLAFASAHGIPVVTRGAASGLAGGSNAGDGSIVLDVSGLDRILQINPIDGTARVEPGVITAELDRAASTHGLFYAPDPGSVEICTIGGNIATNAGGLRGAKYGVTRDAVLALDVVLADGTVISTGHHTIKGVAGLDLTSLFVGSEGSLGVIVGATVRLLPTPQQQVTAAAYFVNVQAAADASVALAAVGVRPAVIELVDGRTLAAIDELRGTSYAVTGGAFLLVQTDGFGAREEMDVVKSVLAATATHLTISADPQIAAELAAARRDALPAIESRGPALIEDIAVPRSRIGEAIARIGIIATQTGADIYVFAHAGDGNIHPIIALPTNNPPDTIPTEAHEAAELIFALALELGGTITGEHGVGILKRHWLEREVGPHNLALQRELKKLLDPTGILNPGKVV